MLATFPWFAADPHPGPGTDPATSDTASTPAHLTDLLLQEQDRLRRLIHRLLGYQHTAHEVDDLTQDVLLSAWQRRSTFRGESTVSTWLTAIAIRRVHNHARWARVRRNLTSWFATEEPAHHTPACPAEHTDEVTAMQRAMHTLRHQDREVLVLHYLEGRPLAEVAALLGLARNAAEQRLSRARTRLRERLEARQ